MEKIYEIIMTVIDVILVSIWVFICLVFALFTLPLHWIEVAIFGSFNVTNAAASAITWMAYNWPTATNDAKEMMIEIGNAIEKEFHF